MNVEDSIIKEICVGNRKIMLKSVSDFEFDGKIGKRNVIVCVDSDNGERMWEIDRVKNCLWWQKADSFVDIQDSFYVKRDDAPGYSKIYLDGKFRGLTFQGFSYEISVSDGAAKYFDFHK